MDHRSTVIAAAILAMQFSSTAVAGDWSQWRGSDRAAQVKDFDAPAEWPKELVKKWQVEVGDGVATPALVGDRLFVFTRQEENEVIRCVNAETGDEIWQSKYAQEGVGGPASGYAGPRATPAVADGKVVLLSVHGEVSCYDATTGQELWRNSDYAGQEPRFATSSSPIIVGSLCIAQLGSEESGAIVAFELANGDIKWKWADDGTSYGSPSIAQIDGQAVVIAPTSHKMVAIDVTSGQAMLDFDYSQGRYNAASPVIIEDMLIYAGPERGTTAERLTKDGDQLKTEELWHNTDNSLQFNSPVVQNGLLFGLSNLNSLFCVNLSTGETAWNAPLGNANAGGGPGGPRGPGGPGGGGPGGSGPEGPRQPGGGPPDGAPRDENVGPREGRPDGPPGGRRPGGRRGRGGGGGGYGSLVAADEVVLALTPASELIIFASVGDAFHELAKYKVADSPTYAYPIATGKHIYIKDQNTLTLWSLE